MDVLPHQYNMAPVAGSSLGTRRTPEQRKRQSENLKRNKKNTELCLRNSMKAAALSSGAKRPPEWKKNISAGLTGKKHPPERTAKQIGNKRGAFLRSAETKKRMSLAAKLRWAKHKAGLAAADQPGAKEAA